MGGQNKKKRGGGCLGGFKRIFGGLCGPCGLLKEKSGGQRWPRGVRRP